MNIGIDASVGEGTSEDVGGDGACQQVVGGWGGFRDTAGVRGGAPSYAGRERARPNGFEPRAQV